ncbi:MAG: phosphatase PAP2 family protein [Bacteroidota bacterium]
MNGEFRRGSELSLFWLAGALGLLAVAFQFAFGWSGGFQAAQAFSGQLPGRFWESLTVLGDERMLLGLLLPFCRRYPRVLWSLVLATVIGGLACRGIKIWFDLPRPAAVFAGDQIVIIGHRLMAGSFPSGHTVSAFAFAGVWLAMAGWRKMWPLLIVAGLAGFSRVAVGAHWPFDVLVAAVIGVLAAWAGVQLARRWRWGLRIRPHRVLVCIAAVAVATLPFESQGYPGSLLLRVAVCLWGLSGFAVHYLLPLLRGGWRGEDRFEA